MSALLANENPRDARYSLAPVYSTADWLDSADRDLLVRIDHTHADIIRALNRQGTLTNNFPFEGIGTENTRHIH